jgi:hypothetical protein
LSPAGGRTRHGTGAASGVGHVALGNSPSEHAEALDGSCRLDAGIYRGCARLTKNWDADVRAFDKVYDHILKMADALSAGIVKQFPAKFGS